MRLPASDAEVVLIHNPRCSKSRATRALLAERGVDFEEHLYLEEPPSEAELEDLARRLGRPPGDWLRKGEDAYREAGLGPSSSDQEILAAMAAHPILIERPIVVRGEAAILGRPPEGVLALFD